MGQTTCQKDVAECLLQILSLIKTCQLFLDHQGVLYVTLEEWMLYTRNGLLLMIRIYYSFEVGLSSLKPCPRIVTT